MAARAANRPMAPFSGPITINQRLSGRKFYPGCRTSSDLRPCMLCDIIRCPIVRAGAPITLSIAACTVFLKVNPSALGSETYSCIFPPHFVAIIALPARWLTVARVWRAGAKQKRCRVTLRGGAGISLIPDFEQGRGHSGELLPQLLRFAMLYFTTFLIKNLYVTSK